jgi:hypothetical protein
MENEWLKIKSFNGSQSAAFEELICQIAQNDKKKDYVTFERVGTPDGGVECYWGLGNGSEIGWQAKYYQSLNAADWGNIKKSLFDAVETHPKLREYIICLPHNLSDGRRGKKTQKQSWDDYKQNWETEIKKKGRVVNLVLWNSSTIISKLLKKENQGIKQFFFNEIEINEERLLIHLNASIKNLGPKYSRELNFKLDYIPTVFDALSRNKNFEIAFNKNIDNYLIQLAKVISDCSKKETIKKIDVEIQKIFLIFKEAVLKISFLPSEKIPVDSLLDLMKQIDSNVAEILNVYKKENEKEKQEYNLKVEKKEIKQEYNPFRGKNEYSISVIRELKNVKNKFIDYLQGDLLLSANEGVLFLNGGPGTGKSHLIADIVTERQKINIPSLLFLGEFFPENDPKIYLQQLLNPKGSLEEYLGALESLARAKNTRILFIVDAINEGKGKYVWKNFINGFIEELKQFKWIGFVFTYRTTFKDVLIPEGFNEPTIEHTGFEGLEYEATKAFFSFYKIEQPKIPILNPEFSNPLFLKTFCLTLFKTNQHRIPEGYEGISAILDAYLESVNKNLGEKIKYPFKKVNLVRIVINKVIAYQAKNDNKVIAWDVGYNLAEEEILKYSNSRGFLEELINEGIFIEDYFYDTNTEKFDKNGISFCYERFNEHLRALSLISDITNKIQLQKQFTKNGKLLKALIGEFGYYGGFERGLLNALSIVIPEKFGVELYEVLKPKDQYFIVSIFEGFLYSLLWRKSDSIKTDNKTYINHFVSNEHLHREFLEVIFLLSGSPRHIYNADFLHKHLMGRSLGDRDLIWTIPVNNIWNYNSKSIINRIIEWAWSFDDKSFCDEDSILLFGKLLAWLFTNSNRHIRDKATKAFACLFVDRTHLLVGLLNDFKNVNDPYVLERILAGILGAVSHSYNKENNKKIAQHIYDIYFEHKNPPLNVLSRDYAKGIVEYVNNSGITLNIKTENLYPPFNSKFPAKFPSEEWIKLADNLKKINDTYTDEQRGQFKITHSVLSWDFARYILGTNNGSNIPFISCSLSSKKAFEVLLKKLKGETKKWFELYLKVSPLEKLVDSTGVDINKDPVQKSRVELYKEVCKSLLQKFTDEELNLFKEAKDYIFSGLNKDKYKIKRFDVALVQKYILKKVFDLGWTMERFGGFDARLDSNYRSAAKAERIGKKYQWIGYYEIMALLSDHFVFLNRYSDRDENYLGSWQHNFRNIDPALLNRFNPPELLYEDKFKNWWLTELYTNWNEPNDTWLNRLDDLPSLKKLINLKCEKEIDWYLLYDRIVWSQEKTIGEDKYSVDRKELWIDIQAFIVTKEVKQKILKRADKDLYWLRENVPEIIHYYEVFNSELYNTDAYNDIIDGFFEKKPYNKIDLKDSQVNVLHTVEEFAFSSEYDMSQDRTSLLKPSEYLFNILGAKFGKNDACIYNQNNEIIGFDTGGFNNISERSFVIRKKELDAALEKNNLEVIWFFCGEKEDIGRQTAYVYRMLYSGVVYFDKGKFNFKKYHTLER